MSSCSLMYCKHDNMWLSMNLRDQYYNKSEYHRIHDYVPVVILGAYGEYGDIINGQYIPLVNQITNSIYYKKANNSNVQIDYQSYCHTWKIVIHGHETIAQIISIVQPVPLDTLRNVYWLVRVAGDDEPMQLQCNIKIYI